MQQDLSDRITVWGDLLYSDRKDTVQAALPGQTFVLITAANPYFRAPPGTGSAFGYFNFRPDRLVGDDHFDQTYRVRTGNATVGVDIDDLREAAAGVDDLREAVDGVVLLEEADERRDGGDWMAVRLFFAERAAAGVTVAADFRGLPAGVRAFFAEAAVRFGTALPCST